MEIREITKENLEAYREFLFPDAAENIGRKYYRAIALHADADASPAAALIWELKDVQKEQQIKAEIMCFHAKDAESAQTLLSEYEKIAAEDGVTSSFFEFTAERDDLVIPVLKEAGFHLKDTESRDIVVTVGDLAALPISEKQALPSYVTNVGSLTIHQFRKGIINCIFNGKTGLFEDLSSLPINWFEPELSCCIQMDGKVYGFLLVHKMASGRLAAELLSASKPATQQDLLAMIRFAIFRVQETYPAETQVVIRRCNEATKNFMTKLFPRITGSPVVFAEK